MRNMTNDQAEALAFDLVKDLLDAGVAEIDMQEAADEFMFDIDPEGEATDEDMSVVRSHISELLYHLNKQLDSK